MVGETLQQGAPGSRSEPKISVHSLKGRFEVTSVEARSPAPSWQSAATATTWRSDCWRRRASTSRTTRGCEFIR